MGNEVQESSLGTQVAARLWLDDRWDLIANARDWKDESRGYWKATARRWQERKLALEKPERD